MWVSLGMLALKAPLNAVFMYGWLGFPAMGGGGAGISFFVLSWLSLFAFLAIWKFDKFYRPMHVEKFVGPRWELLKNHLHVGVPMGLSTFFEVSSFTLMAIFISRLGEETVSAHQIVANLTSMLYMVPLSLGIASSVLISQSLGARWPAVAEFILRRTLKISIVIAAVLATLLYIFKGNVIALYTSDAGVAATAAALVAFGCTYHVFDAMQAVSSFALRGYRVTRAPMFIYGIMLWGVGIGIGYQLAFGAEWAGGPYGAFGFWGATAVGLILTGLSLLAMALWVGRQRSRDEHHSPEEVERVIREARA